MTHEKRDPKALAQLEARIKKENQKPLPSVTPDVLGMGVGLLSDRADLAGMVGALSQTAPHESPATEAEKNPEKPLDLSDLIS